MKSIRTCIACRAKKQKDELLRIIEKDNVAVIDESGKANTRGMYICNSEACINKLLKAKDITKCVKINVTGESMKELLKNLGE
ncbi:MAG: YlxR family protein [Clostridia bacterium]|nr:YlxR family protein [Clostridia bacterium]